MYILGLNAFHGDCAACLFYNNKLIAAVEEERLIRIKHAAGFPTNSIKFCLEYADIKVKDIDYVAINRNPNLRVVNKFLYSIKNIFNSKNILNRISNFKKINTIESQFEKHFNQRLKNKPILVDHHLAHAASSTLMSRFKECNYVTLDGFGDFVSTSIGNFNNNKFNKLKEVQFPHSIGLFYSAITQFLGFDKYGDEYKVMGLSSYGSPSLKKKINEIIMYDKKNLFKLNLKFFKHHNDGIEMSWLEGEPIISQIFSNELINLLGNQRKIDEKITDFHIDVAASAQSVFEDLSIQIINDLYTLSPSNNLTLSGGCAMNSVMNGKILDNTKYKNVYINHSPGDSGGSIGAGMIAIMKNHKETVSISDDPYLGPDFSNDKIFKIIQNYHTEFKRKNIEIKKFVSKDDKFKDIAINLSRKDVIGLFQGRMEFGARALGNRSIISDPRNPNIKQLLNEKIKNREKFRPFAPSILVEQTKNWFNNSDSVPFMSKVYKIKNEKKKIVPGVVHIDETCRLQTVTKEYNYNFYRIIYEFFKITNVPIILNTSFNENEPIVCNPSEAIECFLRTKMDKLYIEDYLIFRKSI
tara:strand:- start:3886 stop:5631 length:1746 start_codon:yes stop_codon:yes gene_type:complete